MGFLKNLFTSKPKIVLHDPVFGEMHFFKHGRWLVNRELNWQTGLSNRKLLSSAQTAQQAKLKLDIDAPIKGPNDKQHEFYRNLIKNYSQFTDSVRPVMSPMLLDAYRQKMPQDFDSAFDFIELSIPSFMQNSDDFEARFLCKLEPLPPENAVTMNDDDIFWPDTSMPFIVEFENLKPINAYISD
jgi:hypothetical protein